MAQNLYKFTEADYEYISDQIVTALKNNDWPTEIECDDFFVDLAVDYEIEDVREEHQNEFMGSYERVTVYDVLVKKVKFNGAYDKDGDVVFTGAFDCTKLSLEYKDWDGEIRADIRVA